MVGPSEDWYLEERDICLSPAGCADTRKSLGQNAPLKRDLKKGRF